MTIDELIENFGLFDEWEDRYRYVIDLGRDLEPLDDRYHTDAFKVEGCMSQVWLVPLPAEDGRLRFAADSDSAIVKGLAAILLTAYSDHTPEEILNTDLEAIFTRIGLDQHLSPNRRNGFFSMVETIKASAKARVGAPS
ncbi:cysteine desufuration protein SufE [Skermanella stibiiresistens SB22]|uniref:Cysteine desufuration protein SufE n=1 Tax=Skermanella stibiiresistens SB22 TaxID=1385369 RepID=W9H524_9PROT|nr:SufE family protein [Skermanella stibiiresistens]EWY38868.1 cysteine desufuration protein SufE [Skermanella stibiiresistens SB22]